jgi:hypothetical protein
MLGGLTTCVAWSLLGHPYFLGLDAAEAGVLVSATLFFTVSAWTPPVGPDTLRVFFPPRSLMEQASG